MSENAKEESAVERRRPDWWALEPAVTERRDIVDELSDATGYFHDDEAAKLRDIASDSGMKPVGIVRAAVEQEIEDREWRCVYFDDSEERGYISSNAYEYYRIHRAFELEYNAAIEALPKEENSRLREVQVFEHAADRLEGEARKHRAKREQAERFLTENGFELPEVEDPRPDSDEPELITDGGVDQSEVDRHAEIMNTPIPERPDTEEMSVEELRREYDTFDVAALSTVEDDERWERHLELWRELESRGVVEFPECAWDGCDSRRWRFEPGGPAHCAECGEPVEDAEHSDAVHQAAHRLLHGGETS